MNVSSLPASARLRLTEALRQAVKDDKTLTPDEVVSKVAPLLDEFRIPLESAGALVSSIVKGFADGSTIDPEAHKLLSAATVGFEPWTAQAAAAPAGTASGFSAIQRKAAMTQLEKSVQLNRGTLHEGNLESIGENIAFNTGRSAEQTSALLRELISELKNTHVPSGATAVLDNARYDALPTSTFAALVSGTAAEKEAALDDVKKALPQLQRQGRAWEFKGPEDAKKPLYLALANLFAAAQKGDLAPELLLTLKSTRTVFLDAIQQAARQVEATAPDQRKFMGPRADAATTIKLAQLAHDHIAQSPLTRDSPPYALATQVWAKHTPAPKVEDVRKGTVSAEQALVYFAPSASVHTLNLDTSIRPQHDPSLMFAPHALAWIARAQERPLSRAFQPEIRVSSTPGPVQVPADLTDPVQRGLYRAIRAAIEGVVQSAEITQKGWVPVATADLLAGETPETRGQAAKELDAARDAILQFFNQAAGSAKLVGHKLEISGRLPPTD